MPRSEGRSPRALRPLRFDLGVQRDPAGSVLIRWGHTHVLCACSVEERVPQHRQGSGGAWLTAEYSLLPGATHTRVRRERQRLGGRTAEIQRLIGRSLRAAVDLDTLGSRTFLIDCDVLQADGGTRCASVTGGFVALCLALRGLDLPPPPQPLAAVSVGLLGDQVLVDLDYQEDSGADVDLNCVATPAGLVELQGTAEGQVFTRAHLDEMLDGAMAACRQLFALQAAALES